MKPSAPTTVPEYIAAFPKATQGLLHRMQETILAAAPDAVACISYGIPTFKINGKNLVHVAGYARHIGFYPGAGGIAAFQEALAGYKSAKGSVQFPLDQPLPLDLVASITEFRLRQEAEKATARKQKRQAAPGIIVR